MAKIKRALISISDKNGILEFAEGLAAQKVEILSTGGTAKFLKEAGVPVIEISDYTGQPEILDGRLKTLHPKIHGGLLAIRSNETHLKQIQDSGIQPIDLVVVNLYPFEQTVAKPGVRLEEAIENIDIGGPTMIRAAAKNWKDVAVIVDPEDYIPILEEMKKGDLSEDTRFRLMKKVFVLMSRYEGAIANYLTGGKDGRYPDVFNYQGIKKQDLRYGENPHQTAAFYHDVSSILLKDRKAAGEPCIAAARQLHGKELSYNNLADLDAALEAAKEFAQPAVVIIKHATPCGIAQAVPPAEGAPEKYSLKEIFVAARDCDPMSAFGGIIAINNVIDAPTASEIIKEFYECVVAPGYDAEALHILKGKKNLRLMEIPIWDRKTQTVMFGDRTFRKVMGGLLVQERDLASVDVRDAKVVTKRAPSESEWAVMEFAWKVIRHIKSNAVLYANRDGNVLRTIGIGGGQVSRVDSTKIGILKARVPVKGSVMASEAFFPFRDNIDEAARAGVAAVIQPGGSLRDEESVKACDEHGMAMVFTDVRHFRH